MITYFYRGFVPYLLRPDGYWSFGAMQGSESDRLLRSLPPTMDAPVLMKLGQAGYCAVLYDNHYAEWVRAKHLRWPAEEVRGVTPEWSDARFAIYETVAP